MGWMEGLESRPGVVANYIATTGAILGGRRGWDAIDDDVRPYGGAWKGPIFVLIHHPEDARPADDVTFLNCDLAVHIAPVLLGDGVRFYEAPGGEPVRWRGVEGNIEAEVVDRRFEPIH